MKFQQRDFVGNLHNICICRGNHALRTGFVHNSSWKYTCSFVCKDFTILNNSRRCVVSFSGFLFSRDGLLATKQFVESLECFGEVDKCFVFERVSSRIFYGMFLK